MIPERPERSCIGCHHWTFDPGSPNYSEDTPGDDWIAKCLVVIQEPGKPIRSISHWYLLGYEDDDGESVDASLWFKTMQKAKTCPDYKPRPGAPA